VSGDLAVCVAVIKQGEAVDWKSTARELPRAKALAIVYEGVRIVGVGAIKRERRTYAAKISSNSGVKFPPETLELGYVAVALEHQGDICRIGLSRRCCRTTQHAFLPLPTMRA
jgi:hypothetical protein